MTSTIIKTGETESSVVTLAHYKLTSVIVPKYKDCIVYIHTGFNPTELFPMCLNNGKVGIRLYGDTRAMHCFNPEYFEGVMYYKFVVDSPAEEDLIFQMWHQDD